MRVPEEIRRVKRPINTIVVNTGIEGPKQYPVRERKGTKYISGGNPLPINGKTIGHIVHNKFVPVTDKPANNGPDYLSYGGAALAYSLSSDILQDLLSIYPINYAYTIMALATLKVLKPNTAASRIASAYVSSFVHEYYPHAALSSNSISHLYQVLGMDGKKREMFFEKRMEHVSAEHHLAIDGTLKQDTSKINDLASFSRKARIKDCTDISVLYAYDIEQMEPISSAVYPGNCVDAVAYRSFLHTSHITKGLLITDKGFTPNNIRKELDEYPDLHYLTPVKRNDARVNLYNMLSFDGVLKNMDRSIQFKVTQTKNHLYLYSFRDAARAALEEKNYFANAGQYNHEDYSEKKNRFGLIVFESDIEMDPEIAYSSYANRWKLEMVFRAYKQDDCLDKTGVQGDFSVYGLEFVNFICTLLTCRIMNKASDAGLLNEMSFANLLDDLNSAWRRTDCTIHEKPMLQDGYWIHTIPKVEEILAKLDIALPNPDEEAKKKELQKQKRDEKKAVLAEKNEPKHRGRPPKPVTEMPKPKRPVGRPRVRPLPDPEAPKRPVGRPRIRPLPDPNAPKRHVGRPRKDEVLTQNETDDDKAL